MADREFRPDVTAPGSVQSPTTPAVSPYDGMGSEQTSPTQPTAPPAAPAAEPATAVSTPAAPVAGTAETQPPTKRSGKRKLLWLLLFLLLVALAATAYTLLRPTKTIAPAPTTAKQQAASPKTVGLVLDTKKNYGDKYANGLLPVGDNKYVTAAAKQGYVYACSGYAQNLKADSGGANTRGPWFTNNNTQYDINKKTHVAGSVSWQGSFSNVVNGSSRVITTNDLPNDHTTGVFPIATTDPAYAYDRNPNSIKAQNFTYNLNANPTYGSPQCMGGQSGVMLTGVAIFSGFDAGGRDAGAWEVQDSCSGHPEKEGTYHYHTLSSCIKDISVQTVIGYALDGFPITGPKVGPGNMLTTSDLDECHGITSQITVDGKSKTTYHYVMTQDFPYSVSCFRGTPISPPGQQAAGTQSGQTSGQLPAGQLGPPPGP